MSRITATDLRTLVETNLSDSELDSIIAIANKHINSLVGTSSNSSNDELFMAELYLSASFLLKRLKTNGELTDSLKIGDITQQIDVNSLIQFYEEEYKKWLKSYQLSSGLRTYNRSGIDWSNKELPGDY